MGKAVILGIFVADAAFGTERMPRAGETVLAADFVLGPGGKGSNQAIACARMGVETHMLSKLGQDDFARMALETWQAAGVTPHAEQLARSYTGAACIMVSPSSGENAILVAPGAAASITPQDMVAEADLIGSATVFLTQLEQPIDAAHRALQIASQAGAITILNPAPAARLPDGMLALCSYVTPNETECAALTGIEVTGEADAARACAALRSLGVGTPIITLGARGVYLDGHGLIPAIRCGAVVDTTGAGDAFNGGFAAALCEGADPREAATFGCAVAGLSVTRAGAARAMPSRAEVDRVLAR